MTDYITEMIKTAGVECYDRYYSCIENKDFECKNECSICDKAKEVFCFPDFTPEKQLKIIELIGNWLSFEYVGCHIDNFMDVDNLELPQAIAKLTIKLMHSEGMNMKRFDIKQKVKDTLEK